MKEFFLENFGKIIGPPEENNKNRYEVSFIFRIFHITRCWLRQSPNRISKSYSTKEKIGIDIDSYKKWIENSNNHSIEMIEQRNRSSKTRCFLRYPKTIE